jgi:hypothetical protein
MSVYVEDPGYGRERVLGLQRVHHGERLDCCQDAGGETPLGLQNVSSNIPSKCEFKYTFKM